MSTTFGKFGRARQTHVIGGDVEQVGCNRFAACSSLHQHHVDLVDIAVVLICSLRDSRDADWVPFVSELGKEA